MKKIAVIYTGEVRTIEKTIKYFKQNILLNDNKNSVILKTYPKIIDFLYFFYSVFYFYFISHLFLPLLINEFVINLFVLN